MKLSAFNWKLREEILHVGYDSSSLYIPFVADTNDDFGVAAIVLTEAINLFPKKWNCEKFQTALAQTSSGQTTDLPSPVLSSSRHPVAI